MPSEASVFTRVLERSGMAVVLTDPNQPDNPIIVVNQAFLDLTGYARDEVIGRNCRFLQGEDTEVGAVSELRAGIENDADAHVELLNYRKDGTPFWNALHIGPICNDDGEVVLFFGTQHDVSEKVETRRQAEEVQESLAFALEAGHAVGTFDWNVDEDRLAVNAQFAAAFDLDPSEAAEGLPIATFQASIDAVDRARVIDATNRAIETGEVFEEEYGVVSAGGQHRYLMGRGRCGPHPGRGTRFAGVVVDITERREAELALERSLESARLTLREVDHRVKNIFALVPALVTMSARGTSDIQEVVRTVDRRVAALSRAHSLTIGLATSREGFDLRALTEAVLEPYAPREPFVFEGPAIRLNASNANVMSLALHELATNAAKYGALSHEEGKVEISWTIEGEGSNRTLAMVWRERGGPAIERPPSRLGFGSRLIEALFQSAGGFVVNQWPREGRVSHLTLRND
ncbi:PAS domain-containing protein [Parvularcula dongshanensis]|nr:PAS domain-containing protein [Parvularcula dongshanensis]